VGPDEQPRPGGAEDRAGDDLEAVDRQAMDDELAGVSGFDPAAVADEVTPFSPPAEEGGEATAIFIDASAIVALVDRDDASHGAAVDAYRNLVRAGYRLFTTNYVVAETFDLLRTGVGPLVARQFLRDSRLAVYHADEQDERRARRLVLDAPAGGNLTLVDAVSLVVMERLGVADAFAVDPSFLADGN
jgi:predicted nucleic acid-binding protein